MTHQPKQLADLFADSSGKPIMFDGHEVLLAKDLMIQDQMHIRIAFQRSATQPRQGVCLKMTAGKLTIDEQTSTGMVLWSDTAPQEVDIVVAPSRRSKKQPALTVWNCWRGRHGETQAWIANAGLRVEELGLGHLRFRCSDGPGDPDFDSLVFDLYLEP